MPQAISEAKGSVGVPTGNRMLLRLIDAGVGSSGVYPAETLQRAAQEGVFPKGLHLFADHPGEAERYDRPERSIRDIAGVLTEDARWDPDTNALVAEAKTFGPWTDVLREMSDSIGLSIRASAEMGEAADDGKRVIERITSAQSVDFVTRAGRGGKVLALLESSRPVVEAMNSEVEEALRVAVKEHVNDPEGYAYVEDFDAGEGYVIYNVHGKSYRASYAMTDGVASIVGEASEVRRTVVYRPTTDVPAPAGQSTATESEEDAMPEISEAQMADLTAATGRVTELTEANAALTKQVEETNAAMRQMVADTNADVAEAMIDKTGLAFNTLERSSLLVNLPLVEGSHRIDRAAMQTRIDEAVAIYQESRGAGQVRGFGSTYTPAECSVEEMDAVIGRAFGGSDVK